MLANVEVYEQNSIRIKDVYFDPYKMKIAPHNARLIFITHSHQDHFSLEDIEKLKNDDTILVIPRDCLIDSLDLFDKSHIVEVAPNKKYKVGDISFETLPMYNINKAYHTLDKKWVGYMIEIDDVKYYIVGDSDNTPELVSAHCDVLFIPIGGTYTMTLDEAVEATKIVNPKIVVPVHYGTIVGKEEDGKLFKEKIPTGIDCHVLRNKKL